MKSWTSHFKKSEEECAICQEPCNDNWCVLLTCGHQGHMKCLNQWTGHARVTYYKHQVAYNVKHIKCNKGTWPTCRVKYGDESILLWKLYKFEKRDKLKWQNFKTN